MDEQSFLYPEQIERLLNLYAGHPQADVLVNRLFPYLNFHLQPLDTAPPGISRIGGWPDLPPGFSWPSQGNSFFMQLRCSTLCPDPVSRLLPPSGMLYFFDGGNECSVFYLSEEQITELVPSVTSPDEEERKNHSYSFYAPHAIVDCSPHFMFRSPSSLTMRDIDLVDVELISECLFPQYHRQVEEGLLRLPSQKVPHSIDYPMSGKLLSCEKLDTWTLPCRDDNSWLVFLEARAYWITECDETHIYIRSEDWLKQNYSSAYMIDTN